MGFPNVTANIDQTFYNSAVGERLVSTECPRDLGEVDGSSIFLAGKTIGTGVIDNLPDFQLAASITSNVLDDGLGPKSDEVHAGIGIQLVQDTKNFTAAAVGYIESTKLTPTESCLWTINQNKKLTNFRPGY